MISDEEAKVQFLHYNAFFTTKFLRSIFDSWYHMFHVINDRSIPNKIRVNGRLERRPCPCRNNIPHDITVEHLIVSLDLDIPDWIRQVILLLPTLARAPELRAGFVGKMQHRMREWRRENIKRGNDHADREIPPEPPDDQVWLSPIQQIRAAIRKIFFSLRNPVPV
jgi:hypothetical protein